MAAGSACPPQSDVLTGVYHPDRLTVLNPCQHVTGTVARVRLEQDGDVHYDIQVDRAYGQLLSAGNYAAQHGWLVIELMPRDGGHLPAPSLGDRVTLVGAFVDDTDHAWHEIHPVFAEAINGGPLDISGPQYGGSSPTDSSYDAASDCHTPSGARCAGYGILSGSGSAASPAPSPVSGTGSPGASCAVSASYNSRYGDYDVYVHSNQPDETVTVSDSAGDSHSWHTDSSGYADVYLRVTGGGSGREVTARVGGASCSTTLP
jgi:hypothetical protein